MGWQGSSRRRKRYAKLKVDVESATVGAQVRGGAIKRSDDRLASVFFNNVDAMLVDHLKPALAELLSHAESLLPALEGARTERDAYAKGPGAAAAWQDLQQLAAQYGGLRRAFGILWRESLRQRTRDDGGMFGEFSNAREINSYSAISRRVPPWPEEPTERLVWIVAGDAKPWLPTPEEQDQALEAERERNAAAMATPAMKRPT